MTRWVGRLIIATVAVYLLTRGMPEIVRWLVLVPARIPYRPWTVVSYMFLHANFWHIFFNMLGLYFFGPRLEQRLGGKHFLGLYFVSGAAGALLSLVTPHTAIIGASAAVFGVLLGFARFWPRERIYIWGVLPIEAWLFVLMLTALSLYGASTGGGNIANFAHLGGFAGGFLYLKWLDYRSPARRFQKAMSAPARRSAGGDGADLKRWQRIDPDTMHPVNRDELERVLRKIKTSGVSSLTPDERAFLDRFVP